MVVFIVSSGKMKLRHFGPRRKVLGFLWKNPPLAPLWKKSFRRTWSTLYIHNNENLNWGALSLWLGPCVRRVDTIGLFASLRPVVIYTSNQSVLLQGHSW